MKTRVWAVNPEETTQQIRKRFPDYKPCGEHVPYVTIEIDGAYPGHRLLVTVDGSIAEAEELLEQLTSAIVAAKAFPTVVGALSHGPGCESLTSGGSCGCAETYPQLGGGK